MIHYDSLHLFNRHISTGMRGYELGDQFMNIDENLNFAKRPVRSDVYFSTRGIGITSIDIHGQNGATQADLSTLLDFPALDFVTDFGTMEHVENLRNCLENVFNLCKVGGVMLHVNPKTGHFPEHNAYHYFTQTFWDKYAKAAGLTLLECYEHPAYHNTETGVEVYAVLQKTEESKFPNSSTLTKLLKYVLTE